MTRLLSFLLSTRFAGAVGTRLTAELGLIALISTTVFADYLSSWLPSVGGFPAGAILRDSIAVAFVGLAAAVLLRERAEWGWASPLTRAPVVARAAFVPFVAFATWVLVLVLPSPGTLPAILGARNLLLYALTGFAAYVLVTRNYLRFEVLLGTLTVVGLIAASLGILDTVTQGRIVTSLGYRRDYSGVEGSDARLIAGASSAFQGYVRASGGISNALVFGYLMAAMAVLATWMLERAVVRSGWRSRAVLPYATLGIVASVACIQSLTRGAMIALVVGLLLLAIARRSKPIVLGSVTTVGMAIFLTWAASGVASAGLSAGPSESPAPGQTAGPRTTQGPDFVDILGPRVTSSDPSSQLSSSLRLDQARRGLESLLARPMGNGLGTEGSASTRADPPGSDIAPDIFILIVALQTGIIGAVLYGLIFAAMILWATRTQTQGRALILAMIGILGIASLLSSSLDAPVFATITWIVILAVSAAPAMNQHHGLAWVRIPAVRVG